MKSRLIAIAAVAGICPASASAQDANNNIRCLIVSNAFAKTSKDAKTKEAAKSAMLFYGGRVSLLPPAQIEAGLSSQHKQAAAANAATTSKTMTDCAQAMNQAVQKIEAAGRKVQPAGR